MKFKTIAPILDFHVLLSARDTQYEDLKDPCYVQVGEDEHIFGSVGSSETETWQNGHFIKDRTCGLWVQQQPIHMPTIDSPHACAPGIIYDEGAFHWFTQIDFMDVGGTIEYAVSIDGNDFAYKGTAISPIPHTARAGVYDPHPSIFTHPDGTKEKRITYTGIAQRSLGNIYLATSADWNGPWESLPEPILTNEDLMEFHNVQGDTRSDYEWCVEGSQFIPHTNLLQVVCFNPYREREQRQHIVLTRYDPATKKCTPLGVLLQPLAEAFWASGELGHATAYLDEHDKTKLHVYFQARAKIPEFGKQRRHWSYGYALLDIAALARDAL